jgi:hypothetical protein
VPSPDGSQQPFFFLLRPAAALLLDGAQGADLGVEIDQFFTELLEPMKLGDLLLRLAQGLGVGKALRDGFASYSAG